LNFDDWNLFLGNVIKRFPDKGIEIDDDNCLVWTRQVKNGKPYKGSGVTVKDVADFKEKWEKIRQLLQ